MLNLLSCRYRACAGKVWESRIRVGRLACLLAVALSVVFTPPVWASSYEEQVIRFSARGEDVEAVELYERELANQDVPVEVLRAVAGSYWRLRQFDTARAMYRRIMQRQPTLSGLIGDEQPPAVPEVVAEAIGLEEIETPVAVEPAPTVPEEDPIAVVTEEKGLPDEAEQVSTVSEEDPTAVVAEEIAIPVAEEQAPELPEEDSSAMVVEEKGLPVAEAAPVQVERRPSPTAAFQVELDALRTAYTQQEKDRERQRQAVEARIVELMVRTEETVRQMDELQRELETARKERDLAREAIDISKAERATEQDRWQEKVDHLSGTLEEARAAQVSALEQIETLEMSVQEIRTAKAEAEDAAAAQIAALDVRIASVQTDLEDARKTAREREVELESRIATLAERETSLQAQRELEQEQHAAERREVESQIEALEENLADIRHQLDSERIAARARRAEHQEVEEQLQNALVEKQAQYTELVAEYEQLRVVAADDAQARKELTDTLAGERSASEASAREAAEAREQLAQKLVAEEERVNALARELQNIQDQTEYLKKQAQARFSELEQERDEQTEALREARMTIETLRHKMQIQEALWEKNQAELRQDLEAQQALQRTERDRFVGTMEAMQLRESELREQHEQQEARQKARIAEADKQIAALEEKLARQEVELEKLLDSLRDSTLQRALQEITQMENDFAQLSAERKREQQGLHDRITVLEDIVAAGAATRADLAAALEREQQQREALDQQIREQQAALAQSEALLEKATSALHRQYDAMRKQLKQDGVSIQVTDDEEEVAGLVPLIGRIEAFTESAALEVNEGRMAFIAEQQALKQALDEMRAERDALAAHIETLTDRTAREQAERQEQFQARIAALEASQREQQTLQQTEIVRLEQALAGARALAAGVQADADASRESQLRLLRAARDTATDLSRRIQELEQGGTTSPEGGTASTPSLSEDATSSPLEAALFAGDLRQGVALYEELSSDEQLSIETLRSIGNAYRTLQQHQNAYNVFARILERAPSSLFAEQKVVMILFDMGQYERALERLAEHDRAAPMATDEK